MLTNAISGEGCHHVLAPCSREQFVPTESLEWGWHGRELKQPHCVFGAPLQESCCVFLMLYLHG